jgi:hypothetical protein
MTTETEKSPREMARPNVGQRVTWLQQRRWGGKQNVLAKFVRMVGVEHARISVDGGSEKTVRLSSLRWEQSSPKDFVSEARELLRTEPLLLPLRIEGWHKSLSDGGWFIKDASGRTLMTLEFTDVENRLGRPAEYGNARARGVVALLNASVALCDQVETQAASITEFQSEQKVMKEAEFADLSQRCPHNCGANCCAEGKQRFIRAEALAVQLRSALTPKGEQS